MKLVIVCILALFAVSHCFTVGQIWQNLKEKCCVSCTAPTVKYYSLRNNKCGESCLDPKDYQRIKIFEPLELAKTNTPCMDFQFTVYNGTVTHGIGSLKATLDMYLQ